MISTGIVRSIDSLGRVVLPKELRTTYDITPDAVLLHGKYVCPVCRKALGK